MGMHKHQTVHGTEIARLSTFTRDGGCSDFASFKYGTDYDETSVHLTPEQVERLAGQFTEAVAKFRACGALPAEPVTA